MADERVRVAVRVRPLLPSEQAAHTITQLALDAASGFVQLTASAEEDAAGKARVGPAVQSRRSFQFDTVLGPDATQGDLYEQCGVRDMVGSALRGINVTIMAYGQTGSGKTWTMEGAHDDFGCAPRALTQVFCDLELAVEAGSVLRYGAEASFLQIYNEQVLDLLSEDGRVVRDAGSGAGGTFGTGLGYQRGLALRWSEGEEFYAEGLTRLPVSSASEAMRVFARGVERRVVASHQMNAASSRSHSIFTLDLRLVVPDEGGGADPGAGGEGGGDRELTSRVTLVDLAGSERAAKTRATGKVLDESISINKSLFVLRQVVKALADNSAGSAAGPSAAPPFRDSKLTSLLKQSLGGNSQTLMVACLNPSDAHAEEALSTLTYAARAAQIVNAPVVNADARSRTIDALRAEVASLRAELGRGGGGGRPHGRVPGSVQGGGHGGQGCEGGAQERHRGVGVGLVEGGVAAGAVAPLVEAVALLAEVAASEQRHRAEVGRLRAEVAAARAEAELLREQLAMMHYLLGAPGSSVDGSVDGGSDGAAAAMAAAAPPTSLLAVSPSHASSHSKAASPHELAPSSPAAAVPASSSSGASPRWLEDSPSQCRRGFGSGFGRGYGHGLGGSSGGSGGSGSAGHDPLARAAVFGEAARPRPPLHPLASWQQPAPAAYVGPKTVIPPIDPVRLSPRPTPGGPQRRPVGELAAAPSPHLAASTALPSHHYAAPSHRAAPIDRQCAHGPSDAAVASAAPVGDWRSIGADWRSFGPGASGGVPGEGKGDLFSAADLKKLLGGASRR